MAYRSFNQRLPKFKWVLLLAILITLPLTVFSVQKVSTNTDEHAASNSLQAPQITLVTSRCTFLPAVNYDQPRVTIYWTPVKGAFGYIVTYSARGNYDNIVQSTISLIATYYPNSWSYNTVSRTSFMDTIKIQAYTRDNKKSPITTRNYQTVNCTSHPKAL